MSIEREDVLLDGVVVLRVQRFTDERGFFSEMIRTDILESYGIPTTFVQHNHSRSVRNVVRGLHGQLDPPMGKLIYVVRGSIKLVELDVRQGSPTFGKHISVDVSDNNGRLVWVPSGFANGFRATSDVVDVVYTCTALWNPQTEFCVNSCDADLGIDWGTADIIRSDRDAAAPTLAELTSASVLLR